MDEEGENKQNKKLKSTETTGVQFTGKPFEVSHGKHNTNSLKFKSSRKYLSVVLILTYMKMA